MLRGTPGLQTDTLLSSVESNANGTSKERGVAKSPLQPLDFSHPAKELFIEVLVRHFVWRKDAHFGMFMLCNYLSDVFILLLGNMFSPPRQRNRRNPVSSICGGETESLLLLTETPATGSSMTPAVLMDSSHLLKNALIARTALCLRNSP